MASRFKETGNIWILQSLFKTHKKYLHAFYGKKTGDIVYSEI